MTDTTQIAKIPLRQVSSVKQLLHNDEARGQLAAVATTHMSPNRLMRVTANAIRSTPQLLDCEPASFLGVLMQCAALGLEPNTVLGHAYIIPFKNRRKNITEAQLVVGYKGLIDLARRSGHITAISANIHYSDDELWEYEEGTEARLRHRPGSQEGNKLHAYAIAKFKDGGHAYVVLPWAQVMKIRNASQGYRTAIQYNKKDSPWLAHEDAMAKKTAIRALAKYLPLSVEFMDAVQADDAAEKGQRIDYAAYAMNPDEDGPTIDGDYIDHEDEPEAKDEKEPEAKDEPEKKPEPKKQAAPREKRDYSDSKTLTADDIEKPAEEKAPAKAEKPAPKPAGSPYDNDIKQIVGDLNDGMDPDMALEAYSTVIEHMKEHAPDKHAEMMAEIEAFKAAAAE